MSELAEKRLQPELSRDDLGKYLERPRASYDEALLAESAEKERIRREGPQLSKQLQAFLQEAEIGEDDELGQLSWDVIDEAENLALSMDPETQRSVVDALRDERAGRSATLDELRM